MKPSPPATRFLLRRASQIADAVFAAANPNDEQTPHQLDVLLALSAHEPCTQTRLTEVTGIDRSTLADIVQRLKSRGLIERRRTKEDARAYAVKLTAQGRQAMKAGETAEKAVERKLTAMLNRELVALRTALEVLVAEADAAGRHKLAKAA